MRFFTISRIIGLFLIIFSVTLLAPMAVSWWYDDGEFSHFLLAMLVGVGVGVLLYLPAYHSRRDIRVRDGFLVVALFWVLLSVMAAVPLVLGAHLDVVDALFEAVSGFTTTGATVMSGLDDRPASLLFYRQMIQWLGGMGMIVLAVAILPMLGIGGMQLYRAEAPGPMKDEKMTPRLAHTAQLLWGIYVGLTVACTLAYWLAGMSWFDAISHSMTTVSTGGFSTHDASLGYFNSEPIETIAIVFMLAGAINFSIHYLAWRDRSLLAYWRDPEVRSFLLFVVAVVALVSLILRTSGEYHSMPPTLRNAVFEVVTVVTSTGFGTVDFSAWPDFLPVLLIFISFVGGCGGSTAGGMKVMRMMLIVLQGRLEILKLIHPRAVLPLRIGTRVVNPATMQAVWGFFAAYSGVFVILMLFMMHAGLDQLSAFSAIATCMNNMGPGLGEVAYSFAGVSDSGKFIAIIGMLLGRLEVFTILVLLTPAFWRE